MKKLVLVLFSSISAYAMDKTEEAPLIPTLPNFQKICDSNTESANHQTISKKSLFDSYSKGIESLLVQTNLPSLSTVVADVTSTLMQEAKESAHKVEVTAQEQKEVMTQVLSEVRELKDCFKELLLLKWLKLQKDAEKGGEKMIPSTIIEQLKNDSAVDVKHFGTGCALSFSSPTQFQALVKKYAGDIQQEKSE